MIRAIRLTPMCLDDPGEMLAGWNVAPAAAYTLSLAPGAAACAVMLWNTDMSVLIATGAAVVGTDKPVTLVAQSGQSITMQDEELGWHLLLTTTGTEAARTIRMDPVVDLADDVHPLYQDDALALARATAAIDAATHYVDELSITCPLGGAALGQIVSAPVDGETMTGQVEAITWTGTPNGHADALTVLRYVPMTPAPPVEPPAPPSVTDDAAETDAVTEASGNVLDNDGDDLTVVAVEGLGSLVGVAVAGSNGGEFTIAADGTWTFDPSGDFSALEGTETAETSVTYHASDGVSEAMGTLTVTVSSADVQPEQDPYIQNVALLLNATGEHGSTSIQAQIGPALIRRGDTRIDTSLGFVSIIFDADGDALHTGSVTSIITTEDFCIEAIVFPLSRSTDTWGRIIYSQYDYGTESKNRTVFRIYDDGTLRFSRGSFVLSSTTILAINTQYHVAVSRSGSSLRLFIDGVVAAESTSFSGTLSPVFSCISGAYYSGYRGSFSGHIRALRVTKDVPRYTAPFTPPTLPFPTL